LKPTACRAVIEASTAVFIELTVSEMAAGASPANAARANCRSTIAWASVVESDALFTSSNAVATSLDAEQNVGAVAAVALIDVDAAQTPPIPLAANESSAAATAARARVIVQPERWGRAPPTDASKAE
jgi:hypothetical protein